MKRTTLTVLFSVLGLLGCDLKDESLGDTGANDSDPNDSDPNDSSVGCTEMGCTDGVYLSLLAESFQDGNYQVVVWGGVTRQQLFSCDFGIVAGVMDDTDCDTVPTDGGIVVTLPVEDPSIAIEVRLDGEDVGAVEASPVYEEVQPNGPGCEPICSQAELSITLGEPSSGTECDVLRDQFEAEFLEVRGCADVSECGQVLEGYSCGCTNDWVGRLDADPAQLAELSSTALELECAWADWGSDCSCPNADGFACIDNICQWNYVSMDEGE